MRKNAETSLSLSSISGSKALARSVTDLRRGEMIMLRDPERAALVFAAEALDEKLYAHARLITGAAPIVATTRRRAAALDLVEWDASATVAVELYASNGFSSALIHTIADPTYVHEVTAHRLDLLDAADGSLAAIAIKLSKLAQVLPAIVMFPVACAKADAIALQEGLVELDCDAVDHELMPAAQSLRRVAEAPVPLEGAEDARLVAFRPSDGGIEHIAIMIGSPPLGQPALVRVHSECFTGDLLGSLRCDCGDQLRGAIRLIEESGGGVLIYLAQEGRGIGLVNKLRAYRLQDSGFDTIDANHQLGFDADERVYQPAAEMLRQLGFSRIRLLTNNPDKVRALQSQGIAVAERVPHNFPANRHNRAYLETKAARGGHLL